MWFFALSIIILRNLSGRFKNFLQRKPTMIMIQVREHVHKMSGKGKSQKLIFQGPVMSIFMLTGKLVFVSLTFQCGE